MKKSNEKDVRFASQPSEDSMGQTLGMRAAGDLASILYSAMETQDKLGTGMISLVMQCLTREKLELSVRTCARTLQTVISGRR